MSEPIQPIANTIAEGVQATENLKTPDNTWQRVLEQNDFDGDGTATFNLGGTIIELEVPSEPTPADRARQER